MLHGPSINVTFGTFSLLLRYAGQHLTRLYILFMKHDRFESNSFGGLIEKAACVHGLAIRLHGGPARGYFIFSCLVAKAGCSDWFGSRISVLSHGPFAPDIHAPAACLISGRKPRSWGGWLHVSPPLPLGPDLTERCCRAWPHFSEEETGVWSERWQEVWACSLPGSRSTPHGHFNPALVQPFILP